MNPCLRWAIPQLNARMKFFFFRFLHFIYLLLLGRMHVCRCTDVEGIDNLQETLLDVYLMSVVVLCTSGSLAQGLPGDAPGSLPPQLWSAGIADAHHNLWFFLKLIFTWVIGIELKFSDVVASTFYPPSHLHGPEFYFLVCLFLCVLLSGEGRWWWVDMSYIDVISFLKTMIMLRQFPLTYFLFVFWDRASYIIFIPMHFLLLENLIVCVYVYACMMIVLVCVPQPHMCV